MRKINIKVIRKVVNKRQVIRYGRVETTPKNRRLRLGPERATSCEKEEEEVLRHYWKKELRMSRANGAKQNNNITMAQ